MTRVGKTHFFKAPNSAKKTGLIWFNCFFLIMIYAFPNLNFPLTFSAIKQSQYKDTFLILNWNDDLLN